MSYKTQLQPWCIVRHLPEMQQTIIERFRHYQDADAHAKALRRLIPNSSFVVLFDPGSEVVADTV